MSKTIIDMVKSNIDIVNEELLFQQATLKLQAGSIKKDDLGYYEDSSVQAAFNGWLLRAELIQKEKNIRNDFENWFKKSRNCENDSSVYLTKNGIGKYCNEVENMFEAFEAGIAAKKQ